jgi:hypothetical protein
MPNIIITENGINKLLQNINIHKASGPDNIHGRIPVMIILGICGY